MTPYAGYSQPYVYDNNVTQVDVINRHVRLQPARAVKKDYEAEALFAAEYQKILDTIPLTPAPQVAPLRKFEFKKNTPAYVVSQQRTRRSSETVQTETVTQVYQAVVQQNVVVQGGNVLVDVPPHVLEKIAPVETRPLNHRK